MITSMLATAVSLTIGLPVFVLSERVRRRQERRRGNRSTSPTRKDTP